MTADPPDPTGAHTLDELAACLRALKKWAGDPSFDRITRRINARWSDAGRPVSELAHRGTVVGCFQDGRRRINTELVLGVVEALHDEVGYVAHWRQALRVGQAEAGAGSQVRVLDRLPDDRAAFTGRADHLERLRRLAATNDGIGLLIGMAGVGKTQLAVHTGHLLADQFDTTLFVNLRGFHPDAAPAEPGAVLDGFLRLLGVAGHQIPAGLPARSALFRERLADRRTLVVLDDAADENQIRPLLPAGPRTLTLVTSRRDLAGLSGAVRLSVEVLTPPEAAGLLVRAAPDAEVGADSQAYARVALRCGHLPLALSLVAGQMAGAPGWTVTDHADRLDDRHRNHRLDDAVRLALSLSYQQLPADRQLLLRRLALHPGPDLDDRAAAALTGDALDATRDRLRRLVAEHLIEQPSPGRYLLHDLVRAYAAERGTDDDRPADRRAARDRLFDHYLYGAAAAMDLLHPAERHRRPTLARDGSDAGIPDAKAALLWLEAERTTLVAVCRQSPQHAVPLAATLYSYLDNGGHPADAIAVHTAARDAATTAADRAGALLHLGVVHWQQARLPDATRLFTEALDLFREAGDARGQARALGNLGIVSFSAGDLPASAGYQAQALERFVEIGDRVGEANTLTNLGDVVLRLDRAAEAAERHRRALVIFRDLGHRGGEATALTNLGEVDLRLGDHAAAVQDHEEALAIFGELGERYGQTCALNGRGEALAAQGRRAAAEASHEAALALAGEIDEPEEQERARAALARLRGQTE